VSEQPAIEKLTPKQRRFVREFLIDKNATKAAIRAGYSERSASIIGWENLRKPNISAEIKRQIPTETEIALSLADIARGDMGDFLSISSMGFVIDLNYAKENGKTNLIKKVRQRTTTSTRENGDGTETTEKEIELYDRQAALVQLGKYLGMFTDKQTVEHSGDIAIRITDDASDD
jgi:phage terminase small subunit